MTQPDALKKNEPLKWSTGSGTDVWAMFCACIAGNLEAVKQLLEKNPALVRCHYNYRKPLYFAVRENRIEVVAFLLERDPNPTGLAVNDSIIEISRDSGYTAMERLLVVQLAVRHGGFSRSEQSAAAFHCV